MRSFKFRDHHPENLRYIDYTSPKAVDAATDFKMNDDKKRKVLVLYALETDSDSILKKCTEKNNFCKNTNNREIKNLIRRTAHTIIEEKIREDEEAFEKGDVPAFPYTGK